MPFLNVMVQAKVSDVKISQIVPQQEEGPRPFLFARDTSAPKCLGKDFQTLLTISPEFFSILLLLNIQQPPFLAVTSLPLPFVLSFTLLPAYQLNVTVLFLISRP